MIRELKRDRISQWERDNFTHRCKDKFREFAEFVSLHYVLSHRNDTEYWKHIQEKSQMREENRAMLRLANARFRDHNFSESYMGGIHVIATGMHYSPTELSEVMWASYTDKESLIQQWMPAIEKLNKNGIVVSKFFMGEEINQIKLTAKKNFKKINFFKPNSSRDESRETYIHCSGLST